MGFRHHLTRDFGHPFTREAGWDLLEVQADSKEALRAYIEAAARKFWKVWMYGAPGSLKAALYKPADAAHEWHDSPGATPVGLIVGGANMSALEFHVDLVMASMNHHVRVALTNEDLAARMRQVIYSYGTSGKAIADASNGLVGAIPLLNECLREVMNVSSDADWRQHARKRLDAMQLATLDELSALAVDWSAKASPPARQRLSRRRAGG